MLIRVGNVWYPNTKEWQGIIASAKRSMHRAFISEKNKLARVYKRGGKPQLGTLRWPSETKP